MRLPRGSEWFQGAHYTGFGRNVGGSGTRELEQIDQKKQQKVKEKWF
jgi:hypothetical protein